MKKVFVAVLFVVLMSFAGGSALITSRAGTSRQGQLAAAAVQNSAGPREFEGATIPKHLKGFDILFASPTAGRLLFERLACDDCHGGGDAPDLAAYPRSRQRTVTAIVDPSAEFAAGFMPIRAQLADGTIVEGFDDEARSNGDTLALVADDGETRHIPRAEIEELQILPSAMPEGLGRRADRAAVCRLGCVRGELRRPQGRMIGGGATDRKPCGCANSREKVLGRTYSFPVSCD